MTIQPGVNPQSPKGIIERLQNHSEKRNGDSSGRATIGTLAAIPPPASRECGRADVDSRDIIVRHLRQPVSLETGANNVSASPPNHVFYIKSPSHCRAGLLYVCTSALEVLLPFVPVQDSLQCFPIYILANGIYRSDCYRSCRCIFVAALMADTKCQLSYCKMRGIVSLLTGKL